MISKKAILITVGVLATIVLLSIPVVSFAIWPIIMATFKIAMSVLSLFFSIVMDFWPVFAVCFVVAIMYIWGKL